jgi:methyl-accepting chemotaxis protein
MQEQAAKLAQVVGVFKLDAQAAIAAPAAPVPALARATVARVKPAPRALKAPVAAAGKPAVKPAIKAPARAAAAADEWEEF